MQTELEREVNAKRTKLLMRLIELRGEENGLRCGKRIDGAVKKGSTRWFWFPSELSVEQVHLRTILPSQIVFDIGDCSEPHCDIEGHVRCWKEKALANAQPITRVLDDMGVAYIQSLSAGKGLHIEVFADEAPTIYSRQRNDGSIEDDDSRPDWRRRFASDVLTQASVIAGQVVVADPRLKSPNDSSHLVRDWGQRKLYWSERTKRMWPLGKPLPDTREEAYEMVPHGPEAIPDDIPVNEGLAAPYALSHHGCPRSTACFDPHSNDGWPGCGDCPRWN